jgi:NTP pyrophosphatase (non-canonical NTP hydrolase)
MPAQPSWPDDNLLVSLARQCASDSLVWFPTTNSETLTAKLVHHALSLCGEAGELANIIKKIDRGSISIDAELTRMDLRGEVTDVFVYLLNIAAILKIDLLRAYVEKREFNDKRFNPRRGFNVTG